MTLLRREDGSATPQRKGFLSGWPDATRRPVLWLALAIGAFATQQIAVHGLSMDGPEALLRRTIFIVGTLVLVGMALAFRRYLGAWLIAAGIAMNALPMIAHGGLMPVAYETVRDADWLTVSEANIGHEFEGGKDIVLWRDDIRFELLSDRYELDVPGYSPNIYSLGDFILFAGIGAAVLQALISALPFLSRRPRNGAPSTTSSR